MRYFKAMLGQVPEDAHSIGGVNGAPYMKSGEMMGPARINGYVVAAAKLTRIISIVVDRITYSTF
jgi:hypothetical protein